MSDTSRTDSGKPENVNRGGTGGINLVVGAAAQTASGVVTARMAGGLSDIKLPVSPTLVSLENALQNLAKAINLGLQENYLETPLDNVYKVARVHERTVEILHEDYMGLGDGLFANLGKAAKSFQLTLRGPDPASPDGKIWIAEHGRGTIRGILSLVGRKLDLIQEFENKVPDYVAQMLDRLEADNMIVGWNRSEWTITTTTIGLDAILTPTGTV